LKNQNNLIYFFKHFPNLDIWSSDREPVLNYNMTIMFSPKDYLNLKQLLENKTIILKTFEIISNNVQKDILEEWELLNLKAQNNSINKKYKNKENKKKIIEKELMGKYPNMVQKEIVGKSFENRDMNVFLIHSPGSLNPRKNSLWINAAQHAREWISPLTALFSIYKFVTLYETNPQIKLLLDGINIYYCPFLNPDGFIYTRTSRMWRKNRRRNSDGSFGVDLNRNWRSGWGGSGSSGQPSSETYRGTSALSEPESKSISNFLTKHPEIKAAVDFHSASQLMLRPYGKVNRPTIDENKLKPLGQKMVDAIRATHGKNYQNILSAGLYVAAGEMTDEFYDNHKIFGFTIELRPASANFNPPPSEILPCAEENFQAMIVLADHVLKNTTTTF